MLKADSSTQMLNVAFCSTFSSQQHLAAITEDCIAGQWLAVLRRSLCRKACLTVSRTNAGVALDAFGGVHRRLNEDLLPTGECLSLKQVQQQVRPKPQK